MTPPASALRESPEGKRSTIDRDAVDFHRTMLDFVRIYQLRDRERTESHKVSASAGHILEILNRLGPISLNHLATELFVEKSTASRVVSGLAEKGYVRRVTDPNDRRALRLEVTPAGIDLHERINAHALQDTTEIIQLFSSEIRRGMIGRMRQIAGASATRAGFSDASCSRISIDPAQATTLNVDLRVAGPFDRQQALALLEEVGLQAVGPTQHFPSGFVVAHDLESGELAGLAGLERYGSEGVLQVVAVRPSSRGAGLARALVLSLMDLARVIGIHDLYVLSQIAPDAIARLGWEKLHRDDLPAGLEQSVAVQGGDASTATVLRWRV